MPTAEATLLVKDLHSAQLQVPDNTPLVRPNFTTQIQDARIKAYPIRPLMVYGETLSPRGKLQLVHTTPVTEDHRGVLHIGHTATSPLYWSTATTGSASPTDL
jgi:hypothetical protein